MSVEAADKLKNRYVLMRNGAKQHERDTEKKTMIPITVRLGTIRWTLLSYYGYQCFMDVCVVMCVFILLLHVHHSCLLVLIKFVCICLSLV